MKNFLLLLLIAVPIFGMTACCDEDNTTTIALGSAGNFTVINMGTNDTIVVDGALAIGGTTTTLVAHNGNIIKLVYEPVKEYEKYNFSTTYVLHDGTVIKDKPEHEYAIVNTEPGTYSISMSASYTKDDNNTLELYAFGSLKLVVKE